MQVLFFIVVGIIPATLSAVATAIGFWRGKKTSRILLALSFGIAHALLVAEKVADVMHWGRSCDPLPWGLGAVGALLLATWPGFAAPSLFSTHRAIWIAVTFIAMLLLGGSYLLQIRVMILPCGR